MKQCFKVFWAYIGDAADEEGNVVDLHINDKITQKIKDGWTIVKTETHLSNQTDDDSPFITVSVLFEKP